MRRKVLFVDDNQLVLDAIEQAMRKASVDWDVEFAARPVAALRLLRTAKWDVLVTDIDMPQMPGFELCTRAQAASPGLRCIALTGAAPTRVSADHRRRFDAFLDKPCRAQALIDAIERSMRRILDEDSESS